MMLAKILKQMWQDFVCTGLRIIAATSAVVGFFCGALLITGDMSGATIITGLAGAFLAWAYTAYDRL